MVDFGPFLPIFKNRSLSQTRRSLSQTRRSLSETRRSLSETRRSFFGYCFLKLSFRPLTMLNYEFMDNRHQTTDYSFSKIRGQRVR